LILSLLEKLTGLLGSDAILPLEQLGNYAVDGLTPQAVVQPATREGVAEVLRWATAEQMAVVPRGGGTQLTLGNLPSRVDLVLDLRRLNRVIDYQPADLTATVEAGITLEALHQELAQGGKFAPLEAPLAQKATIGGVLATNASGPLRHAYGLARDWLIGISVVSAAGVETRAGGRVVKNVTGYDLNKLYTGSLGTLGVIVEASFKLTPVAGDSGALAAAFPSSQKAIKEARALLTRVFAPQGVQVINGPVARLLNAPLTVSDDAAVVVAFFSGRSRAVQRRLDESLKFLQDQGARHAERLDEDEGSSLLRRLTDLGWSPDTLPVLGLKINVPPSLVDQAANWPQQGGQTDTLPGMIADVGFGGMRLLWWRVDESAVLAIISQLRKMAQESGSSIVVERCPLSVKQQIDIWGDSFQGMEIMRRIKQNFDPLGILNPGRFVGRL
jgi:glycolate oxidase FAD binding subunit